VSSLFEVNDGSFESEILQSELPTWVDFWAEWCAPCRAMAPQLEKLAEQYAGKARFAKFDVQASIDIPTRYDVSNLPTLILFVAGEPRERLTNSVPPQKIAEKMAAYIS
jgi:thioredoxin 1